MLKQLVNLLFGMIQISTNNQEITLNYLSCPLIMQGTSIILPINGIIRQITLIHIPLRNVCLDVHFVYSLDIHTAEPHCDDVEEPDEFISKSLRIRFVSRTSVSCDVSKETTTISYVISYNHVVCYDNQKEEHMYYYYYYYSQ